MRRSNQRSSSNRASLEPTSGALLGDASTLRSPLSAASDPSLPPKASPTALPEAAVMSSTFARKFVLWSVLVAISTLWQVSCSYGDIDHAASHRSACLVRRGGSGKCEVSVESVLCLRPASISAIAPRWLGVFVVWVGPVWAWLPLGAWLAWRLRPAAAHSGAAAARRLALRFAPVAAASVFAYLVGINIVRHWVRLRRINPSGFDPSGHTLVFGLQLVPLWAFGDMLRAAQEQAAAASAAALQAEASAGAAEIAERLSPIPSPASDDVDGDDGVGNASSSAAAASSAAALLAADASVDPAAPLPSPPASLSQQTAATGLAGGGASALHRRGASDGVAHHGRRASRAADASAAASAVASAAAAELALERRLLLLCAAVEVALLVMSATTAAFFHTAGEIAAAWAAVAALGLFTAGHLRASEAPWRAWLRHQSSSTVTVGLGAFARPAAAVPVPAADSGAVGAVAGRIARFMRSAVLWAGGLWAASALAIIAAAYAMPGTRIKAGLFAQSLAYDAVILAAAWALGGRTSAVEAEVRAARKAALATPAGASASQASQVSHSESGRAAPASSSAAAATGLLSAGGAHLRHTAAAAVAGEDEPQPLLPSSLLSASR